jgi:hypothetical protein
MKTHILLSCLIIAVAGQSFAAATGNQGPVIKDALLRMGLSEPDGAAECVLKEFKRAAPVAISHPSILNGPGYIKGQLGVWIKNQAEFKVLGRVKNKMQEFFIRFSTADGSDWKLWIHNGTAYGMYSALLNPQVTAHYSSDSSRAQTFNFDVSNCARFFQD